MISYLKTFLKVEAAGGVVLMLVALLAMLVASSPLDGMYEALLHHKLSVGVGEYSLNMSLAHWINDGLMVLFFLVVGQEIKRECVDGALSSISLSILPVGAALGGVLVPAGIYVAINSGSPTVHGWAIPSATDIAFSLGVLSLFGSRIPSSLKIFLMALAVIDDLAAVIIIALFYTSEINMQALGAAAGLTALLVAMNRMRVHAAWPYLLVGLALWLAVLSSGVHATIAGVLIGILMPVSTGERVGYALHAWVAFLILPVFAFANAGVSLKGISAEQLTNPITLGIVAGLFIGKQLGIFGAAWLLVKTGLAKLPEGANWLHLYAVAALAGIGFTMSLFIGALAFATPESQNYIRLGVLLGSFLSAVAGSLLMWVAIKRGQRGV